MPRSNFLPTPEQELLLRAVILKGDEAIKAFEQWKQRTDLNKLDEESVRLLPLLYKNLHKFLENDEVLRIARGTYKQAWYTNQVHFHQVTPILAELSQRGIETMLLKGSALIITTYKDFSLRAIDDFDVLVKHEMRESAIQTLRDFGYEVQFPFELQRVLRDAHGISFYKKSGGAAHLPIDLHWNILWFNNISPDADADFWVNSETVKFSNTETRVLDPASQLIHICIHGARFGSTRYSVVPFPILRWIVDATFLLRSSRMNWPRVTEISRVSNARLQIVEAFSYLINIFEAPIPLHVLSKLTAMPATRAEKIHRRFTTTYVEPKHLKGFARFWTEYYLSLWRQHSTDRLNKLSKIQTLALLARFTQQRLGRTPMNIGERIMSPFISVGRALIRPFLKQIIHTMDAPELPTELTKNCRVYISRFEILNHLPRGGIIAEVGVRDGLFSKILLEKLDPEKFVAIDHFKETKDQRKKYEERFTSHIQNKKVEVHEGLSWDVLARFPDEYFDYVYIDASHIYEDVGRDIAQVKKKIKLNGLIQFNDYCAFSPLELSLYGVRRAVNEFMIRDNWEMIYLGLDKLGYDDVVLRKVK